MAACVEMKEQGNVGAFVNVTLSARIVIIHQTFEQYKVFQAIKPIDGEGSV